MKRQNMKKAFILRCVIVVLTVLVLFGSILILFCKIQNHTKEIETLHDAIDILSLAEVSHLKWTDGLNASIHYGVPFQGALNDHDCAFGKYIFSEAVQNDSKMSAILAKITPLHESIHAQAGVVLDKNKTSSEEAAAQYRESVQPRISELLGLLDEAISERQAEAVTARNDMQQLFLTALLTAVLTTLVCLWACFNIFRYVRHEIADPVLTIIEKTKSLAAGKLEIDFTVKSKNEIGTLGELLDSSVQEIACYIKDIGRAMSCFAEGNFDVHPTKPFIGDFKQIEDSITGFILRICKTLATVQQASSQLAANTAQIASHAQSLSQGATEQALAIDAQGTAITEIAQQTRTVADTARTAQVHSHEARQVVEQSNRQVQNMADAMREINEKSTQIGKIIKTIEDIAFQTNILALNAAVEAARAGTAGKGFAVVADEVRNLAGKSAQAAKSTTALIGDTIAAVHTGVDIATQTASSMHSVVEGVQSVTSLIETLADVSEQQAMGIAKISSGLEDISQVVQTNTAVAEESAATSEELSGQANILRELVGQFNLLSCYK